MSESAPWGTKNLELSPCRCGQPPHPTPLDPRDPPPPCPSPHSPGCLPHGAKNGKRAPAFSAFSPPVTLLFSLISSLMLFYFISHPHLPLLENQDFQSLTAVSPLAGRQRGGGAPWLARRYLWRDNVLELPSSAAITALLISGLCLCVPVQTGGAKGGRSIRQWYPALCWI